MNGQIITSDQYNDWLVNNVYLNVQGQTLAELFMETFKDYPPSQAPASFNIDPERVLKMLRSMKTKPTD